MTGHSCTDIFWLQDFEYRTKIGANNYNILIAAIFVMTEFELSALVFIPDSEEQAEEEVPGFTDDNKEWLKPAKANKKKQGKLPLGGDSDEDEDASDDDEWDDMVS